MSEMTARFNKRSVIRAWIPVLGILGMLVSVPRDARAESGSSFLEAIGIGLAVGTVLGASTLPFYDQPGKHLDTLAVGASAGAAVGLVVYLQGLIQGNSNDGSEEVGMIRPYRSDRGISRRGSNYLFGNLKSGVSAFQAPIIPAQTFSISMPLVSLNW